MSKILIDEAVVRRFVYATAMVVDIEKLEDWQLELYDKAGADLAEALADAALDKMADNARELGIGLTADGKFFCDGKSCKQPTPAHCEAGPEYCQQCCKESFEDRSLALAAAVRYVKNNTPNLVWTEIERALTTPPAPAQEPVVLASQGRDLHRQLMEAAGALLRAQNEPERWGCVGPSPIEIAWGKFSQLASHVCTGIDSPPAPAQEPESAERNFALREAHRNHRADQYFKARPQIDFLENRRIFEAGFDRGWDAKQAPTKQPAKKPLMSAEDRTWWASEVRAAEAKLKEKSTKGGAA